MPEEKKAESKMYGICTVVAGRITGGKGKEKKTADNTPFLPIRKEYVTNEGSKKCYAEMKGSARRESWKRDPAIELPWIIASSIFSLPAAKGSSQPEHPSFYG